MITKAVYLVPLVGALAFVPAVLLARQSQVRLIAFGNSDFSKITLPVAEPTRPPVRGVELEDTVIIGTRPRAKAPPHADPPPADPMQFCGPPRELIAGSGTVRPCEIR